jgi:hypothetical protein
LPYKEYGQLTLALISMTTPRNLTLTSLLLALATTLPAQTLSYTLLSSAGPQPSPRFDGTIAYDPSTRQIYLFGGEDTAPRDDLWIYSLPDRRWREVQVSGSRPPARFGHTSVFDSTRKQVIVFGGQASGFFNDVWAFDATQNTWRQLSQDGVGPSRRYGHSAVYDAARDRMVISHGFTNAGRFDDTWAFDFISNTWRDLSPSGSRPLRAAFITRFSTAPTRCISTVDAPVASVHARLATYGRSILRRTAGRSGRDK